MNEHQRRLLAPVWAAEAILRSGEGSLDALQAAVGAAAEALDGSAAEVRDQLLALEPELESIRFTSTDEEQRRLVNIWILRLRRAAILDDQTFCDWCYGPLTESALDQSQRLDLDLEFSWACESCIARRAYLDPPGDWDAPSAAWIYFRKDGRD